MSCKILSIIYLKTLLFSFYLLRLCNKILRMLSRICYLKDSNRRSRLVVDSNLRSPHRYRECQYVNERSHPDNLRKVYLPRDHCLASKSQGRSCLEGNCIADLHGSATHLKVTHNILKNCLKSANPNLTNVVGISQISIQTKMIP